MYGILLQNDEIMLYILYVYNTLRNEDKIDQVKYMLPESGNWKTAIHSSRTVYVPPRSPNDPEMIVGTAPVKHSADVVLSH